MGMVLYAGVYSYIFVHLFIFAGLCLVLEILLA